MRSCGRLWIAFNLFVFAAIGANGQIRLVERVGTDLFPVAGVDGNRISVDRGESTPALVDPTKIELEGDLRLAADRVYWSPAYSLMRLNERQRRIANAQYRASVQILNAPGAGVIGQRVENALIQVWPGALDQGSIAVFVWIVEGRVVKSKAVPIAPSGPTGIFSLTETFELNEAESAGQVAVLWWQNGAFLPARNRPANPQLAEAVVAAALNDTATMGKLLKAGLAPTATADLRRIGLLHHAAKAGSLEVVRQLLAAGAKPDGASSAARAPLHEAAQRGRTAVVKALLEAKVSKDYQTERRETALFLAAANGHLEAVRTLLEARANMHVHNEENETGFSASINGGYADQARLFLEKRYTHYFGDQQNDRVLITQAGRGNTEVVRLLIERKVRVSLDDQNVTALQAAADLGDAELVRLLLSAGAAVDQVAELESTPLALSAAKGHLDCVRVLIAAGAEINRQDKNGNTALHLAAIANAVVVVGVLIEKGAKLDVINQAQRTPLAMALVADSLDGFRLLRERGQAIGERESKDPLVIEAILRRDLADQLAVLIDLGLNPNSELREGWSVVEVARIYRAEQCERILRALVPSDVTNASAKVELASAVTTMPKLLEAVVAPDHRRFDEVHPETVVEVEVVISPKGEVLFPRVTKEVDHRLKLTAQEVVQRWRLTPAYKGEEAVAVQVVLPVVYPAVSGSVLTAQDVDVMPRVIEQVAAKYPQSLRLADFIGRVTLQFVVNETGTAEAIRVLESSHHEFNEPAVKALEKWRFAPATKNGKPVKMTLSLPIVFSILP